MMMKLRMIAFLVLSVLAAHVSAQTFICNSLVGYDTHTLASAYQWNVISDYGCLDNEAANCNFYFSFCQPAPMCSNPYSACENSSLASNVTIIGGYTTTVFYENESGAKGFYAKFPAGPSQNISNTTTCEPSLIIKFKCNLKAKWLGAIGNATATAPQPENIEPDSTDKCRTIMTFDYDGACFEGKDDKKSGIGGGAIFLIILFSVLLAYFLVGIAYNGFVNHRSGINLIPQAKFWIGLPLNAIEGCRFIIGRCVRPSSPSAASYESV